ncbi:glycosyltransferase family 2 protein [Paenibacillus agaridevorans]|uniref:glycosyltransferase family 2 protein n=1 Tax=Paenibacillus agaridevorans TaxID=171404 RepID=UPI001BE4A405|nr:glycosyltransferase family 2 protein [Paenibacillus agaridevorans]
MNSPSISVVLPTYNRWMYLPRMLDSLLEQEFRDFEILLINNGSTDDGKTDEICCAYSEKSSAIRVFSIAENQGPAPARNLGIQESIGEYLIHLDDDDYCEPNHLKLLHQLIVQQQADVAISGSVHETNGLIEPNHVYEGTYVWNRAETVSEFLKREKFNTGTQTKLYRRRLYDGIRYVPGKIIDDIHVTYRLLANINKAVAHGIPTYRFCKHTNNTTSFLEQDIVWPELLDEYLAMQQDRVAYISEHVPEECKHVRYAAWSYMISMVEKIHHGRGKGCEKQLDIMKVELLTHAEEFLHAPWITEREQKLMNALVLNEQNGGNP